MTSDDDQQPGEPLLVSGPTVRMSGNERPDLAALKAFPGRVRLADIVCRRGRPHLVGVVAGPREFFIVATTEGSFYRGGPWGGSDFLTTCRCGWDHAIDGEALTAVIDALPTRSRRTPTIFADTIERLPPD